MTAEFPVPQATVEAGLLSTCSSMSQWLELSIFTAEDFVAHREIYQFFDSHLRQYGVLPTHSQISTRFDWQPPIGEFRYWLDEMKRYSTARKVLEAIREGYAQISDPNQALGTLLNKLSIIRSEQSNHIQASDSSAGTRLSKFDARTELIYNGDSILGLPTGMKILDDTKQGWIPSSMVGCYARPGVGKTWWLLREGAICWMNGYTVLAITPEMPANMLDLRIDVLLGEMLGRPIDYNKLLEGDPAIRENYEFITGILAQSQRWWTYDSLEDRPIGVGDIAALIRQHDPDIVLIDGVSLLRSDVRGQVWEQMKDICYGLKNLGTIHEVPLLVTHQAVNSARGRRTEIENVGRGDDFLMPSLNDAAYGDAFVQACSDIITMCADKNVTYMNWYSIRKHRERGWSHGLPARMAFAVDFARGKMIDMSELGYNEEAAGARARQLLNLPNRPS